MRMKHFLKTSGLATLAAAMTMAALPAAASARDENNRWQNKVGREDGRFDRGQQRGNQPNNKGAWEQNRQQQSAPVPRQVEAAPMRSQRWNQSAPQVAPAVNQFNRADLGDRSQRDTNRPAPNRPEPNRSEPNRSEQGWTSNRAPQDTSRLSPGWTNDRTAQDNGRNRSYTDNSRNRSYTDRSRENNRDQRRDSYRNDHRGEYRDARQDSYRGDNRNYDRWDRRSWRSDNRYDWRDYRTSNRSVFRLGRYYSPYRNYSYSRVGIGFYLGSLFYGNRYWINDPWSYRLPEVYGPYRWVRYYDDVLLVNVYSGEVVDVIYDFFW